LRGLWDADDQKRGGKRIAIVTDNMDIFTTLTVPNHKLNEVFDVIVNSADYGLLKADQNGKYFDIALDRMWITDYKSVLLVDDSLNIRPLFQAKGGLVHTYDNFEDFSDNLMHFENL